MTRTGDVAAEVEKVRSVMQDSFGPDVQCTVSKVHDEEHIYAIKVDAPDGFDLDARIEELRSIYG